MKLASEFIKVINYLEENQYNDPTFFSAVHSDKTDEDKVLFTIKQLKKEKDLAHKVIERQR